MNTIKVTGKESVHVESDIVQMEVNNRSKNYGFANKFLSIA